MSKRSGASTVDDDRLELLRRRRCLPEVESDDLRELIRALEDGEGASGLGVDGLRG